MNPSLHLSRLPRRALVALLLVSLGSVPAGALSTMPVGEHAMVVSAQRLASQVGADVLAEGGNAVDAAVAVGYALAVTYPAAGNLGGGGFMTIRFPDGRTSFFDFREKAPLAATERMFQDENGAVVPGRSTDSWLAVGVPGSVAGLETAHERYGRLSREAVIAPAEALARDGFVLSAGDAEAFKEGAEVLAKDKAARAIFTHDGQPLAAGDRLVQPDLAASLDLIRHEGIDGFRTGALAQAVAEASRAGGGLITAEDFAHYTVRELAPIHCTYRGFDVISAPPPSSGGVTLCLILNMLEGYDLRAMGFHSAQEVHVLVEAMRRAYRDRNTRLGDPDFVDNPVPHLIDKDYAESLRATIAPDAPTPSADLPVPAEGAQTTHYSVVDRDGMAVSVTTTLNGWFGAARVAGKTGILMNNEMDDFTAKPGVPNMFRLVQGHANAIAPGKTPLSSMSPTILAKDGRLVMVAGSPGGSRIISITAEVIVNVVDHGMTLQDAVDAPRVHHQYQPDSVDIEPGALSPAVEASLEKNGYVFHERPPWGHAESILVGGPVLPTGAGDALRYGANDHRAPAGAAIGN